MIKALDVRRNSGKSPSANAKKAKRPCKASSSKGATKHTDGPSSDCSNIDVNSVYAEVLQVTFIN